MNKYALAYVADQPTLRSHVPVFTDGPIPDLPMIVRYHGRTFLALSTTPLTYREYSVSDVLLTNGDKPAGI